MQLIATLWMYNIFCKMFLQMEQVMEDEGDVSFKKMKEKGNLRKNGLCKNFEFWTFLELLNFSFSFD